MERLLTLPVADSQSIEDGSEGWNSPSLPTDINSSGGFDCNICLDTVQDPVVTMCGHLYCWPCMYKWIHQQSISHEIPIEQQPQCPVCKAEVSEKTLIPLYGRGQSVTTPNPEAAKFGHVIPNRPKGPSCGDHALVRASTITRTTAVQDRTLQGARQHHGHPPYHPNNGDLGYASASASASAMSLAGSTTFHPLISMFGEMICTRFFGETQPFYTCRDSYGMAVMGSSRARRHVVQVDQSLSRLSFFLFCCLVLCLVLF